MAEKNLRDNAPVNPHTSQLKHTERQIFAYFLAKNYLFNAVAIRKALLEYSQGNHAPTSFEILAANQAEGLDKELLAMEESGIRTVFLGEKGYPNALKGLEDAPVMLTVRSVTDPETLFNDPEKHYVTVTGTRDADDYGIKMTSRMLNAADMITLKGVFVSGLSVGIDTIVHREALRHGLPTIAVLPASLNNIYPSCNTELAQQIAATEGCALVSPFVHDILPEASSFIHRNRLLAGLSGSTIIVETKEKGGSMVTARLAHSYGREVFAIPGRTGDIRSEGCNDLIRKGIATLF